MELEASKNNVEESPPNPPTEDQVQKLNLGTLDSPRPTFVNAHIKGKELEHFVYFLYEFFYFFTWTYVEMPRLDPEIAVHKLNI